MLRRGSLDAPAAAVLADAEIEALDRAAARPHRADEARNLGFPRIPVARLGGHLAGGHLARRHDEPPGTTATRRGPSRLADLVAVPAAGKKAAGTCG